MTASETLLFWIGALLELFSGELAGGFYGWYFAKEFLGPGYAFRGLEIGTYLGLVITAAWSLRRGMLSGKEES